MKTIVFCGANVKVKAVNGLTIEDRDFKSEALRNEWFKKFARTIRTRVTN